MFVTPQIAPSARANLRMSQRLSALHQLFAAVDADHSRQLSPQEFVAGVQPLVGTLDEFEQRYLFRAFDFSRSDSIDLAEFDYALFRDLQMQAGNDAANVRQVLTDMLQQKLTAFRALTPEERQTTLRLWAPVGTMNDSNPETQKQNEI